jgi:hypothetical protein
MELTRPFIEWLLAPELLSAGAESSVVALLVPAPESDPEVVLEDEAAAIAALAMLWASASSSRA